MILINVIQLLKKKRTIKKVYKNLLYFFLNLKDTTF
jgi:hypothetical protein